MTVTNKIGLSMTMPEGKLPGFYAQIVKALAGRTQLFDRDKEMLIVSTEDDRSAVLEVLRQYKVETEPFMLFLLPEDTSVTALFDDYGFMTKLDNRYLYANLVTLFTLRTSTPEAEPVQALEQLGEVLVAAIPTAGDGMLYAADRQHDELIARIAAAYGCKAEFR
ncbi:hypothetical protein ACFFK0_28420 [Paenibacillus chartarius]|uniref:Uncharacterized protein n=1 Tax=Paenibacillus chartarius TaxID=747481 RepID=A0ABV6DUR8_9BACL